jgi:hypothetical protein
MQKSTRNQRGKKNEAGGSRVQGQPGLQFKGEMAQTMDTHMNK